MVTDEELYSRYLQGDNEAIDELLVRHKEGLTWFLYGVIHNKDDAEDLMMDTFALLLAKRVKFRNNSSFKTWLYGIGRNLANNFARKHKALLMERSELEQNSKETAELDTQLLTEERNQKLYLAMKRLKPEYAEVLYLSYFEQMDAKQIAMVMKCTVKKVYNLTDRAKAKLKELVDGAVSL